MIILGISTQLLLFKLPQFALKIYYVYKKRSILMTVININDFNNMKVMKL